jgi:hypothetical protein
MITVFAILITLNMMGAYNAVQHRRFGRMAGHFFVVGWGVWLSLGGWF